MVRFDVELSYDRERSVWFVSRSTLPGVMGDEGPDHDALSQRVIARAKAVAGSDDYSINVSGKREFSWPRWLRIFSLNQQFVTSDSHVTTRTKR